MRFIKRRIFLCIFLTLFSMPSAVRVSAWSNGGFSADPSHPDYGTHDWIAHHALDWLPTEEKSYIVDHLASYLYGSELPDNGQASDGIGDTGLHHVYYNSSGALTDDAAAVRASTVFDEVINYLGFGNSVKAAKYAGIMGHYIIDVAVFGHVMGSDTDWGAEKHHSDYETYVNQRTSSYDAEFNLFLSFDGNLTIISAYNAAIYLAYDTTFDLDGDLTCLWMDQNYNWSNPAFRNRCGESLNIAVNLLADVLHTLYVEATASTSDNIPPVTVNDYDGAWHVADFTLTLTATDYQSGVAETYYRINNGSIQNVRAHGQPRITTESANNTLEYWSVDNAGNEEIPHKILTGIKLDKTKPVANAGIDKKVNVGETVVFDAGASTDNIVIVSYEWEFGDGTTGTGKTTSHTYAKPGTYKVTLTVKDAAGNTANHSITVTVAEPFPTWIAGAVIAAIAILIGAVFAMRKRKPKA